MGGEEGGGEGAEGKGVGGTIDAIWTSWLCCCTTGVTTT